MPGAATASLGEISRFPYAVLQAWRGITLQQWTWTTVIALMLLLANSIGLLSPLLKAVPNLTGKGHSEFTLTMYLGGAAVFLAGAYAFLLAVSIAEHGASHHPVGLHRYVAAGLAALCAAVAIEIASYVLIPGLSPSQGGFELLLDSRQLLGRVMWSVTHIGLSGGLALAVYVRFRSARLAREAFNAAEVERVAARREVLASRLAMMQARIEPRFLLGTLGQVEALYEHEPRAGDRMLDSLIAYLHAALPHLRGKRSTVAQELQLAESYLRIMQIRMGSRLDFTVDARPELGDHDFPPMVLLPLVDDALRNGLEPLPHGGTITIAADVFGDRLRVRICDDGMPRATTTVAGDSTAMLRERLLGLYGSPAGLELTANTPQGVVAVIEVPVAAAGDPR